VALDSPAGEDWDDGMSIRTSRWPAGVPCWADLTVPDVAAAREFYSAVLGWTFEDTGDEYGGYVIGQVNGASTAGIGPLPQEGMLSAWTVYLASDDVGKTAAAVAENGGTVLLEPGDVGPMGRMLIAADPTGAVFGVWQAGQHIGAGIVNEPGGMTWEDLRSTDPERAHAFYRSVFGYRIDPLEMAGPDYGLFALPAEEAPLGGMGGMMGAPEGTPSHWLVYFAVADADAAGAAAEAHGGSVLAPAFDTPFGRMSALTDPAGAVFWIAQTDPANMPDRSG
jgi:predicted enzyme related to lactoylglutathione lyase